MLRKARGFLIRLVSVALISTGLIPFSHAGVVDTGYMVDSDAREASLARIQVVLASQEIAKELSALGVDKAMIAERLQGLSNTELLELEGKLDEQVAGGDVIAVVGVVFIVLMILELVGVTDIFKSF